MKIDWGNAEEVFFMYCAAEAYKRLVCLFPQASARATKELATNEAMFHTKCLRKRRIEYLEGEDK